MMKLVTVFMMMLLAGVNGIRLLSNVKPASPTVYCEDMHGYFWDSDISECVKDLDVFVVTLNNYESIVMCDHNSCFPLIQKNS
jgi:hypothetical protein